MLDKEPALLSGAVAALVVFYGLMTLEEVSLWLAALTAAMPLLSGLVTRFNVFSKHTVREAGYTPTQFKARADSPDTRPAPKR